MKKVAFHTPALDVRGTCTAIYDYAHYNETLLNNKSLIVVPTSGILKSDEIAIKKFSNRFQIVFYDTIEDLEDVISECDVLYTIKYGKKNEVVSKRIKTVVHCVFDLSEPHGDVYAAVSESLARKFHTTSFVPHMVGLEPSKTGDNMREELNIPKDAVVFGRHGGQDTFDLRMVHNAIWGIVQDFPDRYFVFVNTPVFYSHPQIIYLDKIIDPDKKNRFISTCDAHIEGGSLGHSFGLACGEFSVNNKPVIAYNGPVWNTAHIDILKEKGIYFKTQEELYNIICTFDPKEWEKKDNNCYKEYSPEKVMKIFKEVFLD